MNETEPVWLSSQAYERLQSELAHLKGEGRERVTASIEEARAHGDLKENAEYHAAREEQGQMEARIRHLESLLDQARVGDAPSGDTVAAGMVVTTVDHEGEESTFLVGSREDRPEGLGVVSASSPLGQALLGTRVGDTVTYAAPAGTFEVTVTGARPLTG